VEKLMKENNIRPHRRRRFKSTTDSRHNLPVAENVLKRDFERRKPNEVWVSDITYIETHEGWLYLAVFIDLFSRKVVGWSMSDRMTADLVTAAYEMGTCRRETDPIDSPFRSRHTIRQYGLPRSFNRLLQAKHEQKSKLLG
jgi:transposase InsO family protein